MTKSAFPATGQWYKGNLHSHTTHSDGLLTEEQDIELYKEAGYSFLCISDHDIYSDYRAAYDSDDFITLPGIEYSAILFKGDKPERMDRIKIHHIHGILGPEKMQREASAGLLKHLTHIPPLQYFNGEWDAVAVAQKMTDMLRSHGLVTVYNHPIWSRVTAQEFMDCEGLQALEVFNYNTVQESQTGYDITYWDEMLRRGKKINVTASDDNHNEGLFEDSCGGWICVKAPELTHEAIMTAFLNGEYYASSGPEIYDWRIEDGAAIVRCSGVNRITFVAGNVINDGWTFHAEGHDNTLTEARYELKGHERYIRCEVSDCYNRTAWTNPFYFD